MPTSSSYERPSWILVACVTVFFIRYGILPEVSDLFARDSWDGLSLIVYMSIIYRLYFGQNPRKKQVNRNAT